MFKYLDDYDSVKMFDNLIVTATGSYDHEIL